MSVVGVVLIAAAVVLLAAAEWPRLARRFGVDGRKRRDRARRKSQLRIVRMRGREAPSRLELTQSETWREAQDLLARCSAAPSLTLSSGVS